MAMPQSASFRPGSPHSGQLRRAVGDPEGGQEGQLHDHQRIPGQSLPPQLQGRGGRLLRPGADGVVGPGLQHPPTAPRVFAGWGLREECAGSQPVAPAGPRLGGCSIPWLGLAACSPDGCFTFD